MSALKDGKKDFYRHLELDRDTMRLVHWFRLLKIEMMKDNVTEKLSDVEKDL